MLQVNDEVGEGAQEQTSQCPEPLDGSEVVDVPEVSQSFDRSTSHIIALVRFIALDPATAPKDTIPKMCVGPLRSLANQRQ